MSPVRIGKLWAIPRILVFSLACINKFERSLALPGTTESIQDKDVSLPQIIKKVFSHFDENVLSSGKEIGRRRAAFGGWLPASGKLNPADFRQQVRQCMINPDLGRPYRYALWERHYAFHT